MNSKIFHKKHIIKYYHNIEEYNIEIEDRQFLVYIDNIDKLNLFSRLRENMSKTPLGFSNLLKSHDNLKSFVVIIGSYFVLNYIRTFANYYI